MISGDKKFILNDMISQSLTCFSAVLNLFSHFKFIRSGEAQHKRFPCELIAVSLVA